MHYSTTCVERLYYVEMSSEVIKEDIGKMNFSDLIEHAFDSCPIRLYISGIFILHNNHGIAS
jgi:hypothetical protein